MAILAAGLLPILALQGQFVNTVERLEHVDARLAAHDNVMATIRSVNLTEKPDGTLNMEETVVTWSAKPVLPARMAKNNAGFPGRFELTLYDVEVQINYLSGRNENFSVRSLGWRATKPFITGF